VPVAADVAVQVASAAGTGEAKRVGALDEPARRPRAASFAGRVDSGPEPHVDQRPDARILARSQPTDVDGVGQDLADVGLGEPGLRRHLPVGGTGRRDVEGVRDDRSLRPVEAQSRGAALTDEPIGSPVAAWRN